MNRLSVGTRTLLGFGFVCLLFEGISWFAIQKSLALKNDSDSLMANSLPGLIAAGEIETGLAESQIQMQRLLQAQTPAQKQILLDELNQTSKMVNDAVLTYADTIWAKADRLNFEKLKRHHSEYVHQHTEFLALVETNRTKAESLLDGPLCQSYAECLKAAKALVAYKADAADEVGKTLVADTDSLTHVLPVISGLAILVVVAIGIMSVRGLTTVLTRVARSLDEGANQVTSTAGQVSSSSEKLAEGASMQAASIEETSSSLEELSSMTQANAENAQKASSLARQARVAADSGVADMEAMNRAAKTIQASSEEVAKIVKSINEIALQTNILALNASVEAARAGKAGAGFAVVADEVHSLAQRCAHSARETATRIEGALSSTAQGVEISSRVSRVLTEIVAKIRKVDELVSHVAAASQEQSQGITQVTLAVSQMDKVTQSNAASAEESAAAAEEFNLQALAMRDAVGDLLRLLGETTERHQAGENVTRWLGPSKKVASGSRTLVGSRRSPEGKPRAVEASL